MLKIANAPCSWGALEFDLDGEAPGYEQVLNEIVETGYEGTELGDWGFMPTDPVKLAEEIHGRSLKRLGAFVPVALKKPEAATIRYGLNLAQLGPFRTPSGNDINLFGELEKFRNTVIELLGPAIDIEIDTIDKVALVRLIPRLQDLHRHRSPDYSAGQGGRAPNPAKKSIILVILVSCEKTTDKIRPEKGK